MATDEIVNDYLARLDTAAVGLPTERRSELIEEVREHIDLARAEGTDSGEPALRAILERLGSPEEIVAAEIESSEPDGGIASQAEAIPVRWRPHPSTEVRALLLLSVGGLLLPFVGPLVGLWVAWSSTRWTRVQKRTATITVLGLLFLPAIILIPILLAGELTALVNNFGPVIALMPLSGLLTALYLFIVLNVDILVVERRHS